MVLYDPHRRWGPRGICRWEDRNLFFAPGGQADRKPGPKVQARWDQAKELCAMCPALAECRRDTLGEEFGVFGGLDQHQRYLIRRQMKAAVMRWPEARRMAWAREMYRLRQAGLRWSVIQTQTGIPQGAGELLIALWKEHLEGQAEATAIVDLELPEPESPGFPGRPGRRHAWVRHRGLVSDAWYRGETPDGEWINCTTTAGRGQVHKWFRRTDVRIYQPQAVVILNYANRPDRDNCAPAA